MTRLYPRMVMFVCLLLSALAMKAQVTVTATAGTTGPTSYTTVNAAFTAINAGTHQGSITIVVSASTTEPATPVPLLKSTSPSSYTDITIKPQGDVTVASAATPTASRAIIELQGADNITIDGDDPLAAGSRNLTFDVSVGTVSATAAISLGSKSTTGADGATNITIKNCIIKGARATATSTTTSYGIVFSNNASGSTISTGAYSNTGVSIINNEIKRAYYGIYAAGASATYPNASLVIKGNTIGSDVSADNIGNRGIYATYTAASAGATSALIQGNDIRAGDYGTTGYSATVAGIELGTTNPGAVVKSNNIHDINQPSTSGYGAHGIYITSGTTNNGITIVNNFIRDCKMVVYQSSYTSTFIPCGVYFTGAATNVVFNHNTIVMNAQLASSTTYSSVCVNASTSGVTFTQFLNNILVNNHASTGAYCIYTGATSSFSSAVLNSNDYYVTTGKVGYYNGAARAALTDWQTATGKDLGAYNENPVFVSATDLHIPAGTSTQLESGGQAVATTGVNTDIDGDVRPGPVGSTYGGGTAPDLGADEFDGSPIDLTAPNIIYTALGATCTSGDRTLTGVMITDGGGVPTTGTLVPRIYYSKDGNTWFSKPGTLTSGNGNNGTWSFTIVAADMGGLSVNNTVSYYIVAQDNAATPNISSSPSGVSAGNVNTIFSAPTVVNTYVVGMSLNGPYNIGTTGTFTTLGNAVAVYNGCPVGGPVTFNLTDASYASETFPIVITQNSAASAGNTLTIKPAAGNAAYMSGASSASGALIQLNGADYVTIDGVNTGGSSFTLENTGTATGQAVIWLSSTGVGAGATNNVIRNLNIKGGIDQSTGTGTSYGIVIAGATLNATATSIAAGNDNDNNTIELNNISKVRYGIFTFGGSTTNPNLGTIIRNNIIGTDVFGTDEVGKGGIVVREEDGIIITQNEIKHIGGDYTTTTGGADRVGISLATDASWTPTTVLVRNATVTRNLVHDIVDERTFSAVGIMIAGADGTNATNNVVANNMVYNILSNGTAGDQAVGIGISSGKADKIAYNSVYMTGDTDPASGSTAPTVSSFAFSISGTSVIDPVIVNNAGYMDLTSSSAATLKHACFNIPSSYTWGAGSLNYNDWFINSSNAQANIGCVGGSGGTFSATFAAWQTASAKDANSKNFDPLFVSATDLHLQGSSPLDGQGTPVTGITTDFDGQIRDALTPDIGADELPAAVGTDMKPVALVSPAVVAGGCYNNETLTVSVKNNSATAINLAGSPVTVKVVVSGVAAATYTTVLNSGTLAAGAVQNVTMATPGSTLNMTAYGQYDFTISTTVAGDVNTSNDVATESRTKDVLSAGTIVATPNGYCATGGKPVLAAAGMTGYSSLQWQQSTTSGTGYANISGTGSDATPFTVPTAITQTMYYQMVATCGTTTANSNEYVVALNNPQVTSTTPGSRCGVGSVTLNAVGSGSTLYWYSASTGGQPIGTGNSFVTPSVSGNTNFYVAASGGTSLASAGLTDNTGSYGTYGNPASSGYGLYFTTTKGMTIVSAYVYPQSAGTCTIQLQDGSGTLIAGQQTTVTFVSGDVNVKTLVQLNFVIPAAGNYRLMNTAGTAYLGRFNPYSGPAYPISYMGGDLVLTQGSLGTTTYYSFFDWVLSTECIGTRTAVQATINTPPTLTTTATPAAICAGQSAVLSTSSSNAGYTYAWTPGGATGNSTSVSPSITTKYYVNATDNSGGTFNGCANIDSVTLTVNPVPTTITVTPASASVCNTAQLLTASGGAAIKSAGFGTQAAQNSATTGAGGYPAPYSVYYGGQRMQMLVLASELSAAGFVAGDQINNIQFAVASLGSNWGGTLTACQNFKVSIGTTSLTSLTSFQSGLTTVLPAGNYTPVAGINTNTFTTPFTWNGTSNLIIETTFSNNVTGAANDVVIHYNSPTAFGSCVVYRADAIDAATAAAATTVSFAYSARPDFTLNNVVVSPITWSPLTGLFTDASATTAYTGASAATVYALPVATTTYTAKATSASNCSSTTNVAITHDCNVPVTLMNFRGDRTGVNTVLLRWETITEVNNKGFELLKSADGINFSAITFVNSKADGGNSNIPLSYVYTDEHAFSGNNYYRLKQVDKDGKVTLSDVVLIKGVKVSKLELSRIYPNPAISQLNFVISSPKTDKIDLVITDAAGKVVMKESRQVIIGDNTLSMNVQMLQAGSYMIKAVCAEGCETAIKKFIKQ